MKVSVLISTRNEEKNIENCIYSIKNQSFAKKNIEIIVIDDNSSDDTVKIAEKMGVRVVKVIQRSERSKIRNKGIKLATGEWIMFLDADMILSKNLIEECVKKIEREESVGLYIPEVILGNGYWQRCRRLERSFYDGTVVDCARFIKRESLVAIGGFDEKLVGPEDWDLDKRLRNVGKTMLLGEYEFGTVDEFLNNIDYGADNSLKKLSDYKKYNIIFHNELKFKYSAYIGKKNYYSKSFAKYMAKWKGDADIKKQFGLWYRYIVVFVDSCDKIIRVIRHPILMIGVFVLRLSVGVIYLKSKYLCYAIRFNRSFKL